MRPEILRPEGRYILYDADALGSVDPDWFDVAHWRARGALRGSAQGRGTTHFIDTPAGELVLRHYRRGGLLGGWLGDRYPWTGFESTRAAREWRLLVELQRRGLPVPAPVAAQVERSGAIYRADLLTRRLAGVSSLAQRLGEAALPAEAWRRIGVTLRRFHDAGACHADLNAHNVLLGAGGEVFLIDFDRGAIRAPGGWQRANLARLRRSLEKIARLGATGPVDETGWRVLLDSYVGA